VTTQRTPNLIRVLETIYGPFIPTYVGSTHEGEDINEAEIVLHELSHHTLLPPAYNFPRGEMAQYHHQVNEHLEKLNRVYKDLHEIYAVAIEILTARRLKLQLNWKYLIRNSRQNTELFKDARTQKEKLRYRAIVYRALHTPLAQTKSDIIMALIDMTRKELRAADNLGVDVELVAANSLTASPPLRTQLP
jgi:hypothetical protein